MADTWYAPGRESGSELSLLLDADRCVIAVRDSDQFLRRIGNGGGGVEAGDAHALLHRDCDGSCALARELSLSWADLEHQGMCEWSVPDRKLLRTLRFVLLKIPPAEGADLPYAVLGVRVVNQLVECHVVSDAAPDRQDYVALGAAAAAPEGSARRLAGSAGTGMSTPGLHGAPGADHCALPCRALVRAEDIERSRIAADLHDGVAQNLSLLKLQLETALARLESGASSPASDLLQDAIGQTRQTAEELRGVIANLSPPALELGLEPGLRQLCGALGSAHYGIGIRCALAVDGRRVRDDLKLAIYRIAQEALNNALRHAAPSAIRVLLTERDDGLNLNVVDDGIGFRFTSWPAVGMGLRNIRDRVASSGGALRINSFPDCGTEIEASWPRG